MNLLWGYTSKLWILESLLNEEVEIDGELDIAEVDIAHKETWWKDVDVRSRLALNAIHTVSCAAKKRHKVFYEYLAHECLDGLGRNAHLQHTEGPVVQIHALMSKMS